MAATALSQRARSPSLNSFSVFTAILCSTAYHKTRWLRRLRAKVATRVGPAKALSFITGPSAVFGIQASAWPIFFLASLVPSQRGCYFPGGQDFLSRGRGFL